MNRKMTSSEQERGYAVCDCGKFAFVFRAELLRFKPKDYHGELCPDCNQWTCSLEVVEACEAAMNGEKKENPE